MDPLADPLRPPSPSACPVARLRAGLADAWHRALGLLRRRDIASRPSLAAAQVAAWCRHPPGGTFPYDSVVAELRASGKHFASPDLLAALAAAREAIAPHGAQAHPRLTRFLQAALDKHDRRFDNPSYLALDGLELPAGSPRQAAERCDHLLGLLMADVLRFELDAAAGRTSHQPGLRPDARVVAKRCRHALLVLRPILARQGIPLPGDDDPAAAAHHAVQAVLDRAGGDDHRTLQLTLLPVSRLHDECMFIRVLQGYETTFTYAAVELSCAAADIARGDADAARCALDRAAGAMGESSPLFSLLGTMRPEAFLAFREFTDGASAIQSRSYKRIESTCRTPDRERLESPAFRSTPEVLAAVLAGQPTIDGALQTASLAPGQEAAVRAAMDRFAGALLKWRRTHHGVAGRMLGDRRGTGDTEGQAYLAQGLAIPVFAPRCPLRAAAR